MRDKFVGASMLFLGMIASLPLSAASLQKQANTPLRVSVSSSLSARTPLNLQGLRPAVWQKAQKARNCAVRQGKIAPTAKLAIIDYDLPSTAPRLWVVDPIGNRVLLRENVAHGSGSGDLWAREFSNMEGSFKTSLGVFRVSETYMGKHGESLRMDGLEPGFNDHARARSIVLHSAWYVEPGVAKQTGRLGRSQGCPAVRAEALPKVEKALQGGGMLFAYASQSQWLSASSYLNCKA